MSYVHRFLYVIKEGMKNDVQRKLRRKGIKLTPPNQAINETTKNFPSEHVSLRRRISYITDIDYENLSF